MFTKLLMVAALSVGAAACSSSNQAGSTDDGNSKVDGSAQVEGGDMEAFCNLQTEFEDFGADLTGFDPNDPNAMRSFFDEITEMLNRAVEVAPADIRAELTTGRDLFVEMKVELEKVDYDFTKIDEETARRFSEIGQFFSETSLNDTDLAARCAAEVGS